MGEEPREKIRKLLYTAVTFDTPRDKQKSIGPSEIGDECDYCVGVALTRKYPEYASPEAREITRSFSLKAWNGTALHAHLENTLSAMDVLDGVTLDIERTVDIFELSGYGTISGHVDLTVRTTDYLAIVDHKSTDLHKLKNIRFNGVPTNYVAQLNLYAFGVQKADGVIVDDVGLHFIPRDSNRVDDVWVGFAPYTQAVVDQSLERLEAIWLRVRNGDLEALERDAKCFNCTVKLYQR